MQTWFFGRRRGFVRFAKYSAVGGATFGLDLALLFALIEFAGMDYVLAAGIGFLVGVSLNYFLARQFVFRGTARGLRAGYLYFLAIAGMGLVLVTGSMFVAVGMLGLPYLLARVGIAGLVGIWNYLANLYFNFQMAGK